MSLQDTLAKLQTQRIKLAEKRKCHIRGSDTYENLTKRINKLDRRIGYLTQCRARQAKKAQIEKIMALVNRS